jgi:GTP-binding protein EngB required for normal cell division
MMRSWGELVRGYLDGADALRLIFLLIDARRIPGEHDLQMHRWARQAAIDERVVMTKSDKLPAAQLARSRAAIAADLEVAPDQLIPFSAVTRTGAHEVRREIASRL